MSDKSVLEIGNSVQQSTDPKLHSNEQNTADIADHSEQNNTKNIAKRRKLGAKLSGAKEEFSTPPSLEQNQSMLDNEEKPAENFTNTSQQNYQNNIGERDCARDHQASRNRSNGNEMIFYLKDIKKKKPDELIDLAESLNVENPSALNKHELIFTILKKLAENGAEMIADGVLEVLNDGYGFMRSACVNYEPSPDDIYVSPNLIRKMGLRSGEIITGPIRAPKRSERYFALSKIDTVNGEEFNKHKRLVHFEDLTPLYPDERLVMETDNPSNISGRVIDIVAPLGKGQRALIVAPPRTGKTILMESIAHSITANNPDVQLIALLIGERPEEVTDMHRSIKGEVVSSTFDEPCQRHVQLAEMVIEKAKRMVENKKNVVILLDSITRLARAYNNTAPSSGKVLTGGVDSNALQRPKRFFGAARNIENGGSLTIIATALVETGSRMDEVIFEEFKGTGNAEIVLDRKISEKRIFPAIDINRSGTRKEDLFFKQDEMNRIWVLRRILNPMGSVDATEFLIEKLKQTKNNDAFFQKMNK